MIVELEGTLRDVSEDRIRVATGAMTYELFVPACDHDWWLRQLNEQVTAHTFQYFEAQGQGNVMLPRLIAFRSPQDRTFFEVFTTVKGIGNRKALRAMAIRPSAIASAIDCRDNKTLVSLPEIGKRSAETIIAELNGKVARFLIDPVDTTASGRKGRGGPGSTSESHDDASHDAPAVVTRHAAARDAVAALVSLGEPVHLAQQWIDRVLQDDPDVDDTGTIIQAAFHFKG